MQKRSAFLIFLFTLALALHAPAGTYTGPTYDLVLPDGWVQIPQDVVQRTMQQVSGGGGANFNFDAAFQLKGKPWFSYPYAMVQTIPYGKEPSEAEMKDLIKQLSGSQIMDEAKARMSPAVQSIVTNMSVKPGELDTTTHTFKAFMQQDVRGIGKLTAMIDSHFGHSGVVNINCYARENDFDNHAPEFQKLTSSFAFHPGQEYQGRTSRDNLLGKIGAFGLIAIIVGVVVSVLRKKRA